MDPQQKNALTQEASVQGTPPWAVELFEKMKTEMCAEMHARIAYSMRIMLDHLKEEILNCSPNFQTNTEADEACYCKELKKCKACKEKKRATKAASHFQRKEEKKMFKQKRRQQVASESSDTDNEVQPMIRQKSLTDSMILGKQHQFGYSASPSVTENLNMAVSSVKHEHDGGDNGAKIINSSTKMDNNGEMTVTSTTDVKIIAKRRSNTDVASVMQSELAEASAASHSQSTPSDSEFEVVSLPPATNASSCGDRDLLTSDMEDTSVSGQFSETETETEFKDCKQSTSEIAADGLSQALSDLQLDDAKTAMLSSTTSSDSHVTLRDSNLIGAEAIAPDNGMPLERQRAPYSMGPEEAGKLKEKEEEIIDNQPLPSEFLRDRKPYSQTRVEPKPQAPEQPRAQAQPETQTPPVCPKPTPRSNSTYRVDNLPESLWDEALTVAAQTYNAAKNAVENLADTFVPGVDRVLPGGSRTTVIPMPAPSGGTSPMAPQQPRVPVGLSNEERKLYDMGFTDTAQNAALLRRHKNDIQRVLQDLLGY